MTDRTRHFQDAARLSKAALQANDTAKEVIKAMTDTPKDLTARADALIYHMGECSTVDEVDRQTVIDMRNAVRDLAAKLKAAEAERDALDAAWSERVALLEKTISEAEAERDAALAALGNCMVEIDDYIRQEYPGDHPVHERYRQRDFSANPARVFLQSRCQKGGEG